MAKKPTYEDLEKKVKELEQETVKRKLAEEALRLNEEHTRLLVEQVDAILWTVDKNLRFTSSRGANLAKIGLQPDQVVGKSLQEFLGSDNEQAQTVTAVRQALSGHSVTYEDNFDGIVWMSHVEPLRDYDGNIVGSVAVSLDITERKQAEEALKESEEKYSNLFHFSNDGIFLHDLEGNILDVNQKTLDQLGYTKSDMLPFKIHDFHPPEALEKSQWAFETIIREGFVSFETEFKKKSGEVFTAEVSSSLFEIGDKKVIQGIVRDITERKQAEEEREKLINELQKAIEEIKTLRGILPLCSFCNKIRDDKGYWEQVDVYIHKHLQADISHSLCPDCTKEHYPDLDIHE
jgi:PAS domain S-box-containing protein